MALGRSWRRDTGVYFGARFVLELGDEHLRPGQFQPVGRVLLSAGDLFACELT